MSAPELKPLNEFEPSYWFPLSSANAEYSRRTPGEVLRRYRKKAEDIAKVFEIRAAKPKQPIKELLYGEVFDLAELPVETFIKFGRERLTVATHANLAIASEAAEKDTFSRGGLVGIQYSPKPDHEYYPEEGLHAVSRFERQEGLGVILYDDWGRPAVFGVRPVKERINTGMSRPFGVGFHSNVQETLKYEFEDLRLPTNRPAVIGITSQSVTKTGEGLKEVEVCRLERIRYVEIFG